MSEQPFEPKDGSLLFMETRDTPYTIEEVSDIQKLCDELGYPNELISIDKIKTFTPQQIKACKIARHIIDTAFAFRDSICTAQSRRRINRKPKTHFRK